MAVKDIPDEHCRDCGQPLFLDKKECSEFIEKKLKQGYIVCSCCGQNKK